MHIFSLLILSVLFSGALAAVPTSRTKKKTAGPARSFVGPKPSTASRTTARKPSPKRRRRPTGGPWKEPTYADSTEGDQIDGEDLTVRRAAVEALGPYNGTVVVADPFTGRVLTMVNQKLALKSGFQPCSTVKVVVGLAALTEGVVERDTPLRLYGRTTMNLTEALARSNNPYFSNLGKKLGFPRVAHYARLFGLGERAGLGIDGERPGGFPGSEPKHGGVGMLSSFGEGITLTPLQLAAMLSSIANGGTLYYLQYPRTQLEAENLVPRVKRRLQIQSWIPDLRPGMMAAVEYGTARKAAYDPNEPILGKTGTCSDRQTPTHLGWFGSFNDVERNKLVVVVLLTGGRPSNGGLAAEIAGGVYRQLSAQRYFARGRPTSPVALVGSQSCCAQ